MTDTIEAAKRQNEMTLLKRRAAYAEIIAQQEAVLLRVAWRFYPGQHDYAQDLVQEALVRGYEAFLDGRFQEGTNARAWLLTILTNCFLSDQRRRRRMSNIDIDTLLDTGEQGSETLHASCASQPEAVLLSTLLDEPLEQALAVLPDEMRLCVILIDIEELSYAEVAEAVNIPIGTVRSRLFRARKQLASQLQAYAHAYRRG